MDCEADADNQKIPHVILNDKLMTDAIFGTIPIKTEHSYSLTSDGDSMPDSPSDTSKIEGKNDKLLLISKTVTRKKNDLQMWPTNSVLILGIWFRFAATASQISCLGLQK